MRVFLWSFIIFPALVKGEDNTEPLILTPFIKSGQIQQAREHSLVKLKNSLANTTLVDDLPIEILSYSGLLTVDSGCNSNIFFWYFPSTYESATAPIILWHGGGPGSSGLSALFTQQGPFYLDEDGVLQFRTLSWTLTRSILYVDSPVGTGFSYHDDRPECHVHSTSTASKHILEVLSQFYELFPEYIKNELFLISGSYGGKFLPAIAYEIHSMNTKIIKKSSLSDSNNTLMNLKGYCIASGFTDPISQIDYGPAYFSSGLIDSVEADYFNERETLAKVNINQGNWSAAYDIIEPLIIGSGEAESHLRKITGITFPFNTAKNWNPEPPKFKRHEVFLNRKEVRTALHVGNVKNFTSYSPTVYSNFREDMYQSVKPFVEELLDSGLYRILIISNELDLIVPHSTISSFLSSLSWRRKESFQNDCRAEKWVWGHSREGSGNNDVNGVNITRGYVRELDDLTLTHLFLRNSGHLWILDQPKVAFKVMTMFTEGQSFVHSIN